MRAKAIDRSFTVVVQLIITFLAALAVPAQSAATVGRNVNLRPDPTVETAVIVLLRTGEHLTIVDRHPKRGYYKVQTGDGKMGYIVAIKPQNSGSGEANDCNFTAPGDGDAHIALVEGIRCASYRMDAAAYQEPCKLDQKQARAVG
jgi:hypothetical protein